MRFHTKKKPQPWEAGALAVARTHIGTWDRRPGNNYKDSHQKRRPDYFTLTLLSSASSLLKLAGRATDSLIGHRY
jgi:hypothetical protein